MKKSEFVKKTLKHKLNTVFGCEGTVERAIDIFEDLGMLPPHYIRDLTKKEALEFSTKNIELEQGDIMGCNEWESEDE